MENINMIKDLISVIIPVYKVEKELPTCIDSIINQTYHNLEIILVDDGSPDNCPKMCDDYAKKDNRIRVIHKENGGLSDARNKGLELAKGEFIGFVDGDDFIDIHMYEKLYYAINSNQCDISECYSVSFTGQDIPNAIFIDKIEEYTPYSWLIESNSRDFLNCVVWNKLYRKDLFSGVKYPVGRKYEDEATIYKLIYKANKIIRISDKLYFYRQRMDSIMHSKITEKDLSDKYVALKEKCEFFEEVDEKAIASFYYARLAIFMISYYKWMKSRGKKRKWYREICIYSNKSFFSVVVPLKYKIYICAFILFPYLIGK